MSDSEQISAPSPTGEEPKQQNRLMALVDAIFSSIVSIPMTFLAEIGIVTKLLWETILWAIRPPYRFRLLVEAVDFIGFQSIIIVGLTGFANGAVFSLQLVDGFRRFGAESQTGSVVGIALARELAPVFSGLMIASRAGSAIATELGSMRVSNQIDALTTMSISPVQFLIVPRVIAGLISFPMMALLFNLIGLVGGYVVGVHVMGLDGGTFQERVRWFVDASDLIQMFSKAMIFGVAVTIIACRQGFYASGGAAGVGQATNKAVVQGSVTILILDYVVTAIIMRIQG